MCSASEGCESGRRPAGSRDRSGSRRSGSAAPAPGGWRPQCARPPSPSRCRPPAAVRRTPQSAAAWIAAQRHLADLVQKQRAAVGGFDSPTRPCTAPVNAPRVWPKSSASSSASGIAAQLMATNGLRLLVESRCSASATSSLPEPVGPSISTGVERGATRRMRRLTSSMQGALPISSGSRSHWTRGSAGHGRQLPPRLAGMGTLGLEDPWRRQRPLCGEKGPALAPARRKQAGWATLPCALESAEGIRLVERGSRIPDRRVGVLRAAQRIEQLLAVGSARALLRTRRRWRSPGPHRESACGSP
jgi:hypothetical protein